MATKLQLYNRACFHLGLGRLTDTDPAVDGTEPAYVFDDIWATVIEDAATRGDWNFLMVTAAVSQSGSTTVIPNYTYAYDHPADWLRTVAFSFDGDFTDASAYEIDNFDIYDERGSWFSNSETLYVRYISSTYIADDQITNFPPAFFEFVAVLLAHTACERLTQGTAKEEDLEAKVQKRLLIAKSQDARNQPKTTIRRGKWLSSMQGAGGRGRPDGTLVGGEITTVEGET